MTGSKWSKFIEHKVRLADSMIEQFVPEFVPLVLNLYQIKEQAFNHMRGSFVSCWSEEWMVVTLNVVPA